MTIKINKGGVLTTVTSGLRMKKAGVMGMCTAAKLNKAGVLTSAWAPPSLGPVPTLTAPASAASTATTSVAVPLMPTYTAGDLVLVVLEIRSASPSITAKTGWTYTQLTSANAHSLWLLTKTADGTEGGTTVTFTLASGARWAAVGCRVQNTSGVGVIGTASTTNANTASQTNTAPQITTDTNNQLLLAVRGLGTTDTSATTKDAAMAWANGSGPYTGGTGTSGVTMWVTTEARATAGATGSRTGTATLNTAATAAFHGILLALKPTLS